MDPRPAAKDVAGVPATGGRGEIQVYERHAHTPDEVLAQRRRPACRVEDLG
ncbi:hypothetical protein AB3X52_17950 [Nocardioides sp. DS6]|uniref:Uncharacterized protein n=1 Tax=Nocardioides eburneus TaxID=3231482 RepID=A0ABV3T5H8_9ACTN